MTSDKIFTVLLDDGVCPHVCAVYSTQDAAIQSARQVANKMADNAEVQDAFAEDDAELFVTGVVFSISAHASGQEYLIAVIVQSMTLDHHPAELTDL